jgi:hypothetical protein
MANPETLPAEFFTKQKGGGNPDTLPADFKGGKVIEFASRPRQSMTGRDQSHGEKKEPTPGKQLQNVFTGTAKEFGPNAIIDAATVGAAPILTDVAGAGGKAIAAGARAIAPEFVNRFSIKLASALSDMKDAWNSYGKPKASPRAELPSPPKVSKVIEPEAGYRPRGERAPEDLGKFPGDPKPKAVDASTSTKRAELLANVLRKSGATKELAGMVSPEQWATIAKSAGLSEAPDEATIKMAIESIGRPREIRMRRR